MPKKPSESVHLDDITYARRRKEWGRIQQAIKEHHAPGHGGFNLRDWPNITHTLNKYRERQLARGMPEKEIVLVQALLAAKRGAFHVDHMIDRCKETGLIQKGELKQEHRMWASTYRSLMERIQNDKNLVGAEKIYRKMRQLEDFAWAPGKLIDERTKHWPMIQKIREKEKIDNAWVSREINKIIHSRSKPETKAFKIALAVSLYADVLERRRKDPVNWTRAYKEAMLAHYDEISHHTDVFNAIIEME